MKKHFKRLMFLVLGSIFLTNSDSLFAMEQTTNTASEVEKKEQKPEENKDAQKKDPSKKTEKKTCEICHTERNCLGPNFHYSCGKKLTSGPDAGQLRKNNFKHFVHYDCLRDYISTVSQSLSGAPCPCKNHNNIQCKGYLPFNSCLIFEKNSLEQLKEKKEQAKKFKKRKEQEEQAPICMICKMPDDEDIEITGNPIPKLLFTCSEAGCGDATIKMHLKCAIKWFEKSESGACCVLFQNPQTISPEQIKQRKARFITRFTEIIKTALQSQNSEERRNIGGYIQNELSIDSLKLTKGILQNIQESLQLLRLSGDHFKTAIVTLCARDGECASKLLNNAILEQKENKEDDEEIIDSPLAIINLLMGSDLVKTAIVAYCSGNNKFAFQLFVDALYYKNTDVINLLLSSNLITKAIDTHYSNNGEHAFILLNSALRTKNTNVINLLMSSERITKAIDTHFSGNGEHASILLDNAFLAKNTGVINLLMSSDPVKTAIINYCSDNGEQASWLLTSALYYKNTDVINLLMGSERITKAIEIYCSGNGEHAPKLLGNAFLANNTGVINLLIDSNPVKTAIVNYCSDNSEYADCLLGQAIENENITVVSLLLGDRIQYTKIKLEKVAKRADRLPDSDQKTQILELIKNRMEKL